MAKRNRILVAVLLVLAIGNYLRLDNSGSVRAVDFLSILVIGALTGVLLSDLMSEMRKK